MRLDLVGTALSAAGLGLIVLGILQVRHLGLRAAEAGSSRVARALPGDLADPRRRCRRLPLFLAWESRRIRRGESALIDPEMLRNLQLRGGVISFLFMYLRAGRSVLRRSAVPLDRARALGDRDGRPAAAALALAAARSPSESRSCCPSASPRRVIRAGFVALFAGLVLLVALLDVGAGAEIITWPLLLVGAGLGALASQLGQRHRVRGARREERRGRRASEHRDAARRLDRHRPGRCRADLRVDGVVLHRRPEQP